MFYVYILESLQSGRFYIGYSHDPIRRLEDHNSGKVISTRNFRPWVKVYSEVFQTETEAIHREIQIKKMKSRHYVSQLIQKEKSSGISQARPDPNQI